MKLKLSIETIRLLQRIAITASMFAFVICVLVLVNFYQLKKTDPLNTPAMKVLIEKMKSNPEDEQLQAEIRQLDLLARKSYFTSQWQIKTGGYLLVFCILIIIICLKTIELLKDKVPLKPGEKQDDFWADRLLNRKWLAYSGLALVAVSLVFTFLTHQQLGNTLSNVAKDRPGQVASSSVASEANVQQNTGVPSDSLTADTSTAPAEQAFATIDELMSNYPCFRGAGGYGISRAKNIPITWDGKSGKNIKWKTPIPLPGYNSPIIWGKKVFLTGANASKREVYCFDCKDGKLLWKTIVEKIQGTPAGTPKVNAETGYSAPTMATDGVRVYAIFANGDLSALDMDGKILWSKNLGLPKNHYGHSSSLITFQDLLIIQYDQTGEAYVMALKGKTGELAWKTSREVKVSWASPILINQVRQPELILLAEPLMVAYNPLNGKELWKIDCISGEVGPSAAYADGIAFSVNEYSKLAAVKVGPTPSLLWESDEYMSDIPSPLANQNYLFLATSYGTMLCYDAKTGNKYWEKEFGTPTYASPILVDGKVYQMDKKGVMHIFKPDKAYSSLGEPQLGEGSVCTPAFVDNMIIIRGDKNLYGIGK